MRDWKVLALCLLMVFLGCDKSKPAAPELPRLDDLVIVAGNNQSALPGQGISDSLTVRAVDQNRRPIAGVTVNFRVTSGGGSLSDTTLTTNTSGLAWTRLTLGPVPGTNIVQATIDGLSGLQPTFTATAVGPADPTGDGPSVTPGGPTASITSLDIGPVTLGVRGSCNQETATITFELKDAEGNPAADGEAVSFDLVPGGSASLSATSATTVQGRVSVTLTSDTLATPVKITATARGIMGSVSIPILGGPPDPEHFSLAAEKLNLPGGVIAGLQDRITAFVFDGFSNPVPPGTSILFSTSSGGIEGSAQTGEQGRASVNLITAAPLPTDGFAIVTAQTVGRGDSLISAEIRILFSGATQLEVQPATLTSDTLQTLSYTVRDPNGNPLSEGTRIQVSAQDGSVLGDVDITLSDNQGQGSGLTDFTFVLQRSPDERSEVTIDVTSPNGDIRRTLVVGSVSGGAGPSSLIPTSLNLTAEDASILADGLTTTEVTAVLTDVDGTPIRGRGVDFVTSAGLVESSDVTNAAGQARVSLTSAASTSDLQALVQAFFADTLRDSVSVDMVGLTLSLTATPDTIAADGNAQSRIIATLEETVLGASVPFAPVSFETTVGTLSASSALTETDGRATVILTSQPQSGRATVTASYGPGLTDRRQVAFVKGPPASIVLVSVDPPAIGVKGAGSNATAFITFEVRDAQGTPVSDGEQIAFTLDPAAGGESVDPDSSATVDGRVRIAFNSGTIARTVRVIATWTGGAISSTPVPVAIHGGLPSQVNFSVAPEPVNLAGRVLLGLESTITAFVFDRFSNPVPEGTSVRFGTVGGGIEGAAETDSVGQASVLLFTAAPIPTLADNFLAVVTAQTVNEDGNDIQATTTVLFSGPTVAQLTDSRFTDSIPDTIFDGGSLIVNYAVSDTSNLPIMGGSTISVTSDVARVGGQGEVIIPDARSGNTSFAVALSDPEPGEDPDRIDTGVVVIRIESLNGNFLLSFSVTVD